MLEFSPNIITFFKKDVQVIITDLDLDVSDVPVPLVVQGHPMLMR